MQRHDDRGVINSRIIPMNSRERENGENGGEKRRGGRKEEISEEEKGITFDDDDYDENNRTIRHAAKR